MNSIPMSGPDLTSAERAAVMEVMETSQLSIGPKISAFENSFADYLGVGHAVGVNSGTSGLHLTMIAAGVRENALVITSPFSFIASANCILYERGIPIFVDVDPTTGNINPVLVAQAAHDLARGDDSAAYWLPPTVRNRKSVIINPESLVSSLRSLLPIHAFGQPADLDPLLETARAHNLSLVEDACEALGAEYKGRKAGTFGDASVFAFYPNKQMTTGEGGMVVTNRSDWNALFRSLRNQGRDIFDAWLNHTRLGYNYRLDELSAALGLAQMQRLDELLAKRELVAGWYNERLRDEELIEIPFIAPATTRMSWFVYVVRIKPPASRDMVVHTLAAEGIPSRPYFTPIHLQPFYRDRFGYQRGDFPVTEYLGDVSLALPFSGIMTETQVDRVCERLRTIVNEAV